MTNKNFFTVQGLISLLFGVPLLLAPQLMLSTYSQAESTGVLDTILRAYGTPLIGFGVLAFLLRNTEASQTKNAYLKATIVTNVLVSIVHIRAILQGLENNLGWTTVSITLGLAIWAGILISKEKN